MKAYQREYRAKKLAGVDTSRVSRGKKYLKAKAKKLKEMFERSKK
jgi:hypothetical protein